VSECPPRILFLIDNLRPGGAQKALLAIIRALRETRAEPRIWCLGGTSDIEEEFRALGASVLGGAGGTLEALAQLGGLYGYLRRERIALLQTCLFHADVAGRLVGRLARRGGLPVVVSSVRASNVRHGWWRFLLLRMTAPLADAFTAVSGRTLDFAVRHEGVRRERAAVIPNGIDVAQWNDLPDPATARLELGLGKDDFVVGTVGRLQEQKGHIHLLDAAARVLRQRPEAVFLIAGYGPLRDALERRAADLGLAERVWFLGYRRDVRSILAALDVFVLPSLWEGMSNAMLEAMAAARPVVATAVDGNLDQVVHRETGLLVPPGDSAALAVAILEIAQDPEAAREMGRRGRRRVEAEFSLDRMTRAYLDLYARLLEEKAGIPASSWR